MIALENYGGGASPALEQTVSESIQTGFVAADLEMHPEEKEILRELAEAVAALAAHSNDASQARAMAPSQPA